MSSGAPSGPLAPKAVGTSVESDQIQFEPLEAVHDSEATWCDARTVALWTPSSDRPFLGTCVVESGTSIEIKAASVSRSNGTRQSAGHWYIKRAAHERLLADAGVYLLTVYAPRPSTPILASVVIPASLLDEHLTDRWYDVDGSRSEERVAQLTWSALIDSEDVDGSGGDAA